jgi:hypothetical protein
VRGVAIEVDDTHLRADPGEVLGDGATDTSAGARDKDGLAPQTQEVPGIG